MVGQVLDDAQQQRRARTGDPGQKPDDDDAASELEGASAHAVNLCHLAPVRGWLRLRARVSAVVSLSTDGVAGCVGRVTATRRCRRHHPVRRRRRHHPVRRRLRPGRRRPGTTRSAGATGASIAGGAARAGSRSTLSGEPPERVAELLDRGVDPILDISEGIPYP